MHEYGCEVAPAFTYLLSLQPGVIRLCVYWDECEPKEGEYDFSIIEYLLQQAAGARVPVVLTIGAKAPRWPEFFWPAWLSRPQRETRLLRFVQKAVEQLSSHKNILLWQVENEPIDPSGPENETIPFPLLQREVALVRSLDARPVMLTVWGNDERKRNSVAKLLPLADVIGIDLYPKQFLLKSFLGSHHRGPDRSAEQLREWISRQPVPIWIAELQAEPWEKNSRDFWDVWPKSMNPEQLQENFSYARSLPASATLAWGYEYWWAWKERGRSELLELGAAWL